MPDPRPAAGLLGLWRWHATIGRWDLARSCEPETAAEWLAIWRAGEPGAAFRLGDRRPRTGPEAGDRHAAG